MNGINKIAALAIVLAACGTSREREIKVVEGDLIEIIAHDPRDQVVEMVLRIHPEGFPEAGYERVKLYSAHRFQMDTVLRPGAHVVLAYDNATRTGFARGHLENLVVCSQDHCPETAATLIAAWGGTDKRRGEPAARP